MGTNQILVGDCRSILASMPAESVHSCVTSPPYWGMRDYGHPDQIGMEPSMHGYIGNLASVFREVWRVLRPDGSLWLNLGDTYSSTGQCRQGRGDRNGRQRSLTHPARIQGRGSGLPLKNLCGIPWRVALALQEDGWILRQDVIWHKPNPMPESVRDRCTRAHEYVFHLVKSPRYYWSRDAVTEKGVIPAGTRGGRGSSGRLAAHGVNSRPAEYKVYTGTRNKRSVWSIRPKPTKSAHFAVMPADLARLLVLTVTPPGGVVLDPFAGTGTTGCVALDTGRQFVMIEQSEDHAREARDRVRRVVPDLFPA